MMRRRRQGFLLVEAMLAAVAIAVGLVFISGAIGASLRALTRLQQAEQALRLAASTLDEAGVAAQHFRAAAPCHDALVITPVRVRIVDDSVPVASVIAAAGGTRLHTAWPMEWVEE